MNIENYCFCELAPLYVLNLLSDSERLWVEQQLAECPELIEELNQYQAGATAINYSAPVVPMAANLKERLFTGLNLEIPANQPQQAANNFPSLSAVRFQDVQWQPHPTPGVETAIFHTDVVKREIVGLLRAAPGVQYPFHRHAIGEDIYMLEGDLIVGNEVYGAFDYIRSEVGSTHAPYTTGGCMFFFRTSMDDEYPDIASVEA